MQIMLNQDEIEEAIRNHVLSQLAIREDQEISIDLRAGRGENGFTATLDVWPQKGVTNGPKPAFAGARTPVATKTDAAKESLGVEIKGVVPGPCLAVVEETKAEEPREQAASKAPKKGIFAAALKPVAEETATATEAEPGAPDEETPAEEEARQTAEEEGSREDAQNADEAAAGQPESKKSIFTFAPKKSAG